MLLYHHHTADDVIELNDATGSWRPVAEADHISPAELAIAYRHSYPICGSYTIENDQRYFLYWTPGKVLVFRTPEGVRHELFKYIAEEKYRDLMNGARVTLTASTFRDGRLNPGFSDFKLIDKHGNVLHQLRYFSQKYLDFYLQDFTYTPDRDLSDWDFFVALQRGIEEMASKSTPVVPTPPSGH